MNVRVQISLDWGQVVSCNLEQMCSMSGDMNTCIDVPVNL